MNGSTLLRKIFFVNVKVLSNDENVTFFEILQNVRMNKVPRNDSLAVYFTIDIVTLYMTYMCLKKVNVLVHMGGDKRALQMESVQGRVKMPFMISMEQTTHDIGSGATSGEIS